MTRFDAKEARALVERLDGYTPGPWFRHDFRQAHDDPKTSSDISVSCTHPDHLTVAIMHGADQGHDRPEGIEAALHNAALIAAAPDLHRHLAAALAEIERLRRVADVSAIIAKGALDPTAREACLRRDVSRVRDYLRKALKGDDQ